MRKRGAKKKGSRYRLFRLIVLSAIVLTMAFIFLSATLGSRQFGALHELLFEFAGPVEKGMARGATFFSSLQKKYLGLLSVQEENERLWAELQQCRQTLAESREALATNTRLQRLLDFKTGLDQRTIAARVIGKDPSLWFRTVVIDRGSRDGVDRGMAVISSDGIVGQVFMTSPHYAKVLLAIAPSSALDVLLQKSRVRGILKGTGKLTCRLDYILKTEKVAVGDRVVTAGYGGLFPTGLPVGTVTRVVRERRGMFLNIEVKPAADFLTLENLLIIAREQPFKSQP